MTPLLLFILACANQDGIPTKRERRPDVVLFTVDTTRADALGVYGASPSPSPRIDALAATGVVVEEVGSVTPLTAPAHASLMSGRYPDRHGVRSNDDPFLAADIPVLSERMSESGYQTAAFVSASVLRRDSGLSRGFDHYDDTVPHEIAPGLFERTAAETSEAVNNWLLSAPRDRPLFLWVHLYEPHAPYAPSAEDLEAWPDPYLADVHAMDRAIGLMMDLLDLKRPGPRWTVLVGDHGEGRGDHGEQGHGLLTYRSTMRVPLVVSGPTLTPRRIDGPVSQVDLLPTLLELLHLPTPAHIDGLSWSDAASGGSLTPRLVFGESLQGQRVLGVPPLRVVQDATHRRTTGSLDLLTAWQTDPEEHGSLDPNSPAGALLAEQIEQRRRAHAAPTIRPARAQDEALLALGYLSGGALVTPATGTPLTVEELLAREATLLAVNRERSLLSPDRSLPMLRALVASQPSAVAPRRWLADALLRTGDAEAGLEVLAPLMSRGGTDQPDLALQHAQLQLASGAPEGLETVDALLSSHPHWGAAAATKASLLLVEGELESAEALLAPFQADATPPVLQARAELAVATGDGALALALLDQLPGRNATMLQTQVLRVRALSLAGKGAEARHNAHVLAQQYPEDVDVVGLLAVLQHGTGAVAESRHTLARALALGHPDPILHELQIDAELRVGSLDEAERMLELLSTSQPEAPGTEALRARLALQRGDLSSVPSAALPTGLQDALPSASSPRE